MKHRFCTNTQENCLERISSIAPGRGHVIVTGGTQSPPPVGADKNRRVTQRRTKSHSVTVTENLTLTDQLNSETGFYRIPASSAHIPGSQENKPAACSLWCSAAP